MPRYCVYCGSLIKETDRFCISCGKPLLSNLPKPSAQEAYQSSREIPEEKLEKQKDKDKKTDLNVEIQEEEMEEPERKKPEKVEAKELSNDVKDQINLYLELLDIRAKKKSLDEKLKEFLKLVKSPKYETDFDYAESINIQLEAVKKLIEELKQKETQVKEKMKDKFILEKLDFDIANKKDQLTNLIREHKLMKIKDKNVVESLKERYKQELQAYEAQRTEIVLGIKAWIIEMRREKDEVTKEQKYNKARFSSKEITEEMFKDKDTKLEKKIRELESKIKTLDELSK